MKPLFDPHNNGTVNASQGGDVEIAPVPEVGAYAMMLAGFGLVGVAAARRKSKQ